LTGHLVIMVDEEDGFCVRTATGAWPFYTGPANISCAVNAAILHMPASRCSLTNGSWRRHGQSDSVLAVVLAWQIYFLRSQNICTGKLIYDCKKNPNRQIVYHSY